MIQYHLDDKGSMLTEPADSDQKFPITSRQWTPPIWGILEDSY